MGKGERGEPRKGERVKRYKLKKKKKKGTNYYIQNKLQGCIVQHRKYSQYFIIIINGV